jgi:urease accessory protein
MAAPCRTITVTATPTMPDGAAAEPAGCAPPEAALLAIAQWLSPAFPIGAFAYSHGLERAIADGVVRDATSLRRWLAALISHGSARSDAILLAHALRPGADLAALSRLALALAASVERKQETLEQGAAFVATVNALTDARLPALAYPVAVGAAAGPLGLPSRLVLALFLQGFAANLIAAGVRFIPLGQTEGQVVLASLRPLVAATAEAAGAAALDALGAAAFRSDLAAMRHETMSPRMFRT